MKKLNKQPLYVPNATDPYSKKAKKQKHFKVLEQPVLGPDEWLIDTNGEMLVGNNLKNMVVTNGEPGFVSYDYEAIEGKLLASYGLSDLAQKYAVQDALTVGSLSMVHDELVVSLKPKSQSLKNYQQQAIENYADYISLYSMVGLRGLWQSDTMEDRARKLAQAVPENQKPHPTLHLPPSFYEENAVRLRTNELIGFAESEVDMERKKFSRKEEHFQRTIESQSKIIEKQTLQMQTLREDREMLISQLEKARTHRNAIRERSITITERVRHFRDE